MRWTGYSCRAKRKDSAKSNTANKEKLNMKANIMICAAGIAVSVMIAGNACDAEKWMTGDCWRYST